MLWAGQCLLDHLGHFRELARDEGLGLEPKAGKDLAAKDSFDQRQGLERSVSQHKPVDGLIVDTPDDVFLDRKSTRLNSSHMSISYAVFCLKKKIRSIPAM